MKPEHGPGSFGLLRLRLRLRLRLEQSQLRLAAGRLTESGSDSTGQPQAPESEAGVRGSGWLGDSGVDITAWQHSTVRDRSKSDSDSSDTRTITPDEPASG